MGYIAPSDSAADMKQFFGSQRVAIIISIWTLLESHNGIPEKDITKAPTKVSGAEIRLAKIPVTCGISRM
jgi:hypothetical protein